MTDNVYYIISAAAGLFGSAFSLSVENWASAGFCAALFFLAVHCLIKENG